MSGVWSPRRTAVAWALSRAALVLLVVHPHLIGAQQDVLGDVRLYQGWGHGLVHGGGLPSGDRRWQYPPGAAAVLAVPAELARVFGVGYLAGLVALLLVVDLALLVVVRIGQGPDAGRYWVLGVLALGPVAFARFDLVPAALAVAGLYALVKRRPGLAGFALGLGGAVKVWPLLLVVPALAYTLETGREARRGSVAGRMRAGLDGSARLVSGVVAAAAAVAAVAVAAGWSRGATGFLGAQGGRGLQLEAVPALPFVLARIVGAGPAPTYSYGSLQFSTTAARVVASACTIVETVVVLGAAAVWWWRAVADRADSDRADSDRVDSTALTDRLLDRSLILVLVVVLTSRVLSPQYLLWVLALAAVRPRSDSEPRDDRWRAAALIVGAALLSQVIYPIRYNDLTQGRIVAGLLLVARDALLVIALGYAARAARATRRREPSAPRPPAWPRARAARGRRPASASDVPAGAR